MVTTSNAGVDYFPSYEIITGPHTRGAYFAADLRSVTDDGVAHVMRLFLRHYTGEGSAGVDAAPAAPGPMPGQLAAQVEEQRRLQLVLCDEEALARHQKG